MTNSSILESGAVNVFLPVALVLFFIVVLNLVDKFSKESLLHINDKKHKWRHINMENESRRCTNCESLLVNNSGIYCDTCGLCFDSNCINKVSTHFKCKDVSLEPNRPMKHHWMKGNLPDGCVCDVCVGECAEEDSRCVWCHRTVHSHCLLYLGGVCDFGKLREVLVPPTHVRLRKKKRLSRGPQLEAITQPSVPSWTPLFVIGNSSSGSRAGDSVLRGFRHLLNPIQVLEFRSRAVEQLAFLLSLLQPGVRAIILVAGGDGTVAGVLTALYSRLPSITCEIGVGLVPLGTGNDLARVLGWGSQEPSPFSPLELLDRLIKAQPTKVDRWRVCLRRGGGLALGHRSREVYMYNYLSFGVDAKVTLDFHKARNSSLYLGGRLINKALYLAFGSQEVVERNCTGLEKELQVEMDGVRMELPQLEAVVVLNIPSWGAGCHLWQLSEAGEEVAEQSMSDGKLEVVGIYSSFHMAQLQVGLSTPYRIGQASQVKITLRKKLPMQIDGEPWMQPAGQVDISCAGQVTLLNAPSKDEKDE